MTQKHFARTEGRYFENFWLTLIISAIYVLSPIDAVPEALVGPLALVDDLVVVGLTAKSFYDLLTHQGWQSRAVRYTCGALLIAALVLPVIFCYFTWNLIR